MHEKPIDLNIYFTFADNGNVMAKERCKQKSLRGVSGVCKKANLVEMPLLPSFTPYVSCVFFIAWNVDVNPGGAAAMLEP